MTSPFDISAEEMVRYRATAKRRQQAEQQALVEREKCAWTLARQAAEALRQRFAVSRVVVFGSLVHPGCFTPWSDVDIAAWGLKPHETFRAIGVAMDISSEIPINLVDMGACRASIREVIEREGIPV
jgi:predicted nucleotidyltransferase